MIKVGHKFICNKEHNIYENTKLYHVFGKDEIVEVVEIRDYREQYTLGCKTSLRSDVLYLDIEEILNEKFLTIAEWRDQQINSILDD